MIYGYIRVSSDKQTVENQKFEIERFCEREKIQIDGWISETISGTKQYDKRKLGSLLKKVTDGDLIICSEISRLGRSLFMIMEILNICMTKACRVWTVKDGYRLGEDIQSKVLAFAFGLSAEIERNLISQRTKEALARKRAEEERRNLESATVDKVICGEQQPESDHFVQLKGTQTGSDNDRHWRKAVDQDWFSYRLKTNGQSSVQLRVEYMSERGTALMVSIDGKPLKREDGKFLKGPNYKKPVLDDLVKIR